MAVPSLPFIVPALSELQPGEPGKSEHAVDWRSSLIHLEEWLGLSFVAAQDHDHDTVNSKAVEAIGSTVVTQANMAPAAVGRVETKTTTEEQSVAIGGGPGTTGVIAFTAAPTYGFMMEVRRSGANAIFTYEWQTISSTYATRFLITNSTAFAETAFGRIRYIQASPPNELLRGSGKDWGQWLFVLKDDAGKIQRTWSAGDPPWWLANRGRYPKGHPAGIHQSPHPFVDVVLQSGLSPGEIPAGWELRLIDLRPLATDRVWLPEAAQLQRLQAGRASHRAGGIPASELDAWEADAQTKVDAEAADAAKATSLLSTLDEERDVLIGKVQHDLGIKNIPEATIDERVEAVRKLTERQRGRLRKIAGTLNGIEVLRAKQPQDIILDIVNRGSKPVETEEGELWDLVQGATKELPANERQLLPNVTKFRDTVKVRTAI